MVSVHVLALSRVPYRWGHTRDLPSTILVEHKHRRVCAICNPSPWMCEFQSCPRGSARSRTDLVPNGLFTLTATRRVVDVRSGSQLPQSYLSSEPFFRSR